MIPASAKTAANEVANCPARSRISKPELGGAIAQIYQKVPDLLPGPQPVRVGGHGEDVHIAGLDFHDEKDVEPLEGHRAVDVEEVAGQHRRRRGAQELPPGGVGLSLRGRRDPQGLEDPADRRGADPVAEREQFTLDPLIPPAAVLLCEALNQRDGVGADRRSTCARRVSPVPGRQAPVPAQDGGWGDQAMGAQFAGQQPGKRGEHGTTCQFGRGLGLTRRSTATSWRKTSNSTFFDAEDRPNSHSQPATRPKIR